MAEQEKPLIIQYTDLLHRYRDPMHSQVRAFVEQHQDDAVLMRRIETLNRLFKLRGNLMT